MVTFVAGIFDVVFCCSVVVVVVVVVEVVVVVVVVVVAIVVSTVVVVCSLVVDVSRVQPSTSSQLVCSPASLHQSNQSTKPKLQFGHGHLSETLSQMIYYSVLMKRQ